MKNNYLQTLTEYIEYDGIWHKEDKDGNCSHFTMRDLQKLLEEAKQEQTKEIIKMIKKEQKRWFTPSVFEPILNKLRKNKIKI